MKNSASVVPRQSQHLIDKNLFYLKETNYMRLSCHLCGHAEGRRVFAAGRSTSLVTAARAHRHPCCVNLWSAMAENIGFPARVSCFRVCKGRCVLFTGHIRAPPQCFRTLPVVFFSCSIIKIIHLKSPMLGGLWPSYIFSSVAT